MEGVDNGGGEEIGEAGSSGTGSLIESCSVILTTTVVLINLVSSNSGGTGAREG